MENEIYHNARLSFRRFSLYRGLMLYTNLNYSKKIKGIVNSVQFENKNQYLSPVMLNNPSEDWRYRLDIHKKIKRIKYRLKTTYSTSNYLQSIDQTLVKNKKTETSYQLSAKTLFDKFPTIEIGYKQRFGKYTSSGNISNFVTQEPFLNIEYDFLENFSFSFEFEQYHYQNKSINNRNTYKIAQSSLFYQQENSAWSFLLTANNLFNQHFKQSNSFSSYIVSDRKTYITPRIVLFSIGYKL